MSKKLCTIAVSLLIAAASSAIPAKRTTHQVKQPDGTSLTVGMRGDENFHFASTTDGIPVVRSADGYYYASISADGKTLVASTEIAHNAENRTEAETAYLNAHTKVFAVVKNLGAKRAAQRNATRIARLPKCGNMTKAMLHNSLHSLPPSPRFQEMAGAEGGEGIGVTGKRKGLVILVNFKDVKMQANHTRDEWNDYFNKEGYNKLGNSGSVHDYFYNQSYGLFDLSFDVIGPVTVSKNMAAYGGNDSEGNDVDPAGMVYEACQLAKQANPELNFADYDWDGDGRVDQVYIVYAGYGEAADSYTLEDCIWQHEWDLTSAGYNLYIDGKRINTYGCSSELNGYQGYNMDGIGTACHEFSHCLGLPDLYDTAGNSYGMDSWDLMDYGSYAGDGYQPVGYNSYEKWVSGWLQPTVLDKACYVKDIKPLSEQPEAYIIYNEKTPTEYYLLENRQQTVNDKKIPGHGMLVIHIDYDFAAWQNNTVNNNANHQRFTIVPADNRLSSQNNYADTYPGTTGNNQLTDTSTPAAKLFNANTDGRKYLGKPITDIYESASGLVSFTFMGGESIDKPAEEGLTSTPTANGFTAAWSSVEDAETYNIELREKGSALSPEENFVIGEDMREWGDGLKSDGTTDISASLDEVMSNPGWTGTKVFKGIGGAKLGSAKQQGLLSSPLIENHQADAATIRVMSKPYGNDVAQLTVSIVDSKGNTISSNDIVPDGTVATIVLENSGNNDYHVNLQPQKRGYVNTIEIYDGEFTADDFANYDKAPKPVTFEKKTTEASQQIYEIKSTNYTFSGLSKAIYQWRVQAAKGDLLSAWTTWQTVDLTGETAIKDIQYDNKLPSTDDRVVVYSTEGIMLGTTSFGEFLNSGHYTHGSYILKTGKTTICIAK